MSLKRISHDDDNHVGSAKRDVANGVAGLDGSTEIPLAQIKAALTGKKTDLNAVTSSNTFTGNDSVNRAIAHGLGSKPKILLMFTNIDASIFHINQDGIICMIGDAYNSRLAVTAWDDTNFYVGNATNYALSGNHAGRDYHWKCIS